MRVKIADNVPSNKRTMRNPRIDYNLKIRPWQMQPFCIHPVLPGESLQNALIMARAVSDPLKDKLMGWWFEHYVFYVKHTQLDIKDDLVEMHLNAAHDMSAHTSLANLQHFHAGGGINYTGKCLDVVREWYFRDEDEAEPTAIGGLPPAKINLDGWWQSMKLESEMPANTEELLGENPQLPDDAPAGFETHYAQWEAMRAAGMTAATFEDYLRTFGVRLAGNDDQDEQKTRPELIRYHKEFTFPTNTVDPATGTPSSAAVWSISERADKTRYFKEPGFIFGVVVARPKVHLSVIEGSMTGFMDSGFNWLPAVLGEMPFASLEEFATATGPAPGAYGQDYWIDMRDLFLYGEQFRNHDLSDQGAAVALPDTTGNVRYATAAMADGLFLAPTSNVIRIDGMMSLNISGKAGRDTTG